MQYKLCMDVKVPIPLIWDADGSPDSIVALLYFLRHPAVNVKAATVSCGQAIPEIFVQNLGRMFSRLDRLMVPYAAGRSTPLAGHNAFPPPWREGTNTFWGLDLPETTSPPYPGSAVDLLLETLQRSPTPLTLFVSGTHTNLAEALRRNPEIRPKITSVQVMGGALHGPGNMHSEWPQSDNRVSEWNLWVDPTAAEEVFDAGLPIFLTPLDATNQVLWSRADAAAWQETGTPEGVLAGEILDWFLNNLGLEAFYFWDLVTAVHFTDPHLSRPVKTPIKIAAEPESEQGRTVVYPDLPPNTTVFLESDAGAIKAKVLQILGDGR
jgi:inosine-uridine nucleoside N-ribohydrolase